MLKSGPSNGWRLFLPVVCACLCGILPPSRFSAGAQEAVRMSLASAEAAEARRKAATTLGYYNVKLGPSVWRFGAALGTEWSDNIRLTGTRPQTDFIFRPELMTRMLLPVTDQNSISLAFSGGYSKYVDHSEYDRFFIRPGSELSFDIYVGDVWINLHDRFSILQDTYQDPTVVGSADFSRLENAAGLTATWDLNKILLRWNYDHINYASLQSETANQPDGRSEVVSLAAGYAPAKGVLYGVELGGSLIHYESNPRLGFEDAKQWNAGLFADLQVSQYIQARASAGYTVFTPEPTSRFNAPDDFSGLYAQIGLTHRLNQFVSYTLSGGRNLSFTYYGGTVDLWQARWFANWKLLEKITLTTGFDYEHGEQLTFYEETFDRLGPNLSIGRMLTEKLGATLRYQFYWRESDVPSRDYTVNVVNLTLRYSF